MDNGTHVTFSLDLPYLGLRNGAGIIVDTGLFAVLGETYTVQSDGTGDYAAGEMIEVKRSSMRKNGLR